MCVNVCDLPTLPQALSLMCVQNKSQSCVRRPTCAQAELLYMRNRGPCNAGMSLCSRVLSYIMCLLLQVMMQVIIMRGMRHQHLELDPGELLA